jgi:hypothetical protein
MDSAGVAWPPGRVPGGRVAAFPSWLITAALAGVWLAAGPRTSDLAAQAYRASAFAAHGFTIWDNSWYGGHHVPGYSLVFPALGAALGVRLAGALAAIVSAVLFEALAGRRTPFATRAWFATGCAADLLIGRLTYATGVAFGLAAVTALVRDRPKLAIALACACAATSPVSGVFLAIAGCAMALAQRRIAWLAIAASCAVVVGALTTAFPEGGSQPFTSSSFVVTLTICAIATALVARHRVLCWPLLLYLAVVVVAFTVPSPLGGNVTRFGTTFVAPALLAVAPGLGAGRRAALIGVLCAAAAWQWVDPLTQAARGWADPSSSAAYYQPLLAHLPPADGASYRVEVPFTRGHWESVYLPRTVALARGWERQLDRRLNPIFYRPQLTADAYHRWLRANAVRFVALPDAVMDQAGAQEARIVARGPAFLHQVWNGAHWRLFAVTDAVALASPPAAWTLLSEQGVRVGVPRAGNVLLRVHWTPYWHLAGPAGCLARHGSWTLLRAARPGVYELAAHFSLGRLLESMPRCTSRSS